MAEDIVVIGAGGFGRETLDVIEAINAATAVPVWNVIGVVDDGPADMQRVRLQKRGVPLLGGLEAYTALAASCRFVVGVGAPLARARIAARLASCGRPPAALIHPAAVIGTSVSIGQGTVICGGVQVSTNVTLGSYVHLNPGAIIGHDSVLEDCVSVNPGAIISGEVRIGTGSLIGAGSVTLQGRSVGERAVVGAAACVTRDVGEKTTVTGVPARPRKENR